QVQVHAGRPDGRRLGFALQVGHLDNVVGPDDVPAFLVVQGALGDQREVVVALGSTAVVDDGDVAEQLAADDLAVVHVGEVADRFVEGEKGFSTLDRIDFGCRAWGGGLAEDRHAERRQADPAVGPGHAFAGGEHQAAGDDLQLEGT